MEDRSYPHQQSLWRPIAPHTGNLPPRQPSQPPPRNRPAKRPATLVACENCRRIKGKCDGLRPICTACRRHGRTCAYRAEAGESSEAALRRQTREASDELRQLRKSHNALRRLVSSLQTGDEDEVSAIVRRLRQSQDPDTVAEQLEGGDLLLQLHVAPETKFRFDFPHALEMPRALLTSDNPYLDTVLYESSFAPSSAPGPDAVTRFERTQPQYLRPYATARIADPRLARVDVSRWTNACSDNDLMRSLVHTYLLSDYQTFPSFHKDYFLEDMLSGSGRFCSSLLVNAVLAHACTCFQDMSNRAEYWNPNTLAYKFNAEARRLWDMERLQPSAVTTVQAAMIINKTYNVCSMDKIGLSYGAQAASIATEMGMFEPNDGTLDEAEQIVRNYTAWALYSFLNLQCYFLFVPSLIRDPPAASPPNPDDDPQWYGELLLQYPTSKALVPLHFPWWTKFKFDLLAILRPVTSEVIRKGEKRAPSVRQGVFLEALTALRNLFTTLPSSLSPSQVVFPLHMTLHLCYHNILLTVSRLLIQEAEAAPYLEVPSGLEAEITHSKICFETIMRLYYLRHGYEGGDMILLHFLAVASFMALSKELVTSSRNPSNSTSSQDAPSSTLILTAKGLYDQGHNYFISAMILHVLRKQMASNDADVVGRYCTNTSEDPELIKRRGLYIKTQYPLNIVKITNDPKSQRLEEILRQSHSQAMGQDASGMDGT